MGKSGDPEGEATTTKTLSKPKDPKMQAAKVHMLNGTSKDFQLLRGSDGEVLFTLVSTDLSIEEREYFSLCFYDDHGIRHWLYNDKKIWKQLKGLPWEFSFEVKFYPTAPATLNDENARYNLFLQLRKDVASGRLPATIPTHALLGALIAQSEYGDADSAAEYERYLRDAIRVPNLKDQAQLEQLLEKVKELHREQKGLTASEAELKYLDACKQLSLYGVFVFDAKDKDDNDVGIGICATGINIYRETIRIHRFPWQSIIKISYRKNSFSVKLKAGELDSKKEVTQSYKVQDYLFAKRIWKCGVEHHTFFRLIQPEDKPKGGLFRWGSSRFRYQGRTQFQTKMASQMFDGHGGTVQRANSARLTQSCDNGLNKENISCEDKSATLGRVGRADSPITSPGVSYEISSSKRAGTSNGKVGISLDADDELVYTPVDSPTSAAYYLSERSSLRSPYSSGAVSPNDWSAWGRDVSYRQTTARRNLFGRENDDSSRPFRMVTFGDELQPISSTAREADLEEIPIQQSVTLYHRGFYTEPPREPTVRIQHYAPRNGYHPVERLEPIDELIAHPIRFFVNLSHSGESDRIRINRHRHSGTEDYAVPNPTNYSFPTDQMSVTENLPRQHDLIPASLREHAAVYYEGKGSGLDYDQPVPPTYRLVARLQAHERPSTSHATMNGHNAQSTTSRHPPGQLRSQQEQQEPLPKPKKQKNISKPNNAEKNDSDNDTSQLPWVNQKRIHHFEKQKEVQNVHSHDNTPKKHAESYYTKDYHINQGQQASHSQMQSKIEKDEIASEFYGHPSTSYEGQLEDTRRNDDLEQLPILDHAQVYHPGQSWLKVKTSPVKETREEHKDPKKKAILHVTSSQKTAETHEPEKSEVRIVARILPSETDETSSPVPVTKARDSSSSLFGFLKTSNKKNKPASTEAEVVSYPSTSDRYDGPLDSVNRHDDLITLPLEHQPRVPYVAKYSKPVVTKEVHDEPETETKRFRFIARMRHDGEEETIEKDQVKPELYGLASTSYDGPLEDTHRNDDLEQLPILDHAQVYHPGQSWLKVKTSPVKETREEHKDPKKKAILHVTSSQKTAETHEPEKSEVRIVARILPSETDETSSHEPVPATKARDSSSSLFGFLKTSNKKSKPASTEAEVVSYPSTSDRYDGPLDSVNRHDDLITLPLEHQPRVPYVAKYSKPVVTKEVHDEPETETKRFRFIARMRHDGEEETIEKDQVKPELYGLASTSYDGPLEDTHRNDDLEQLPILDHAQVYHPGQSWLKVKTSPVKESHEEHKEVKEPKKKAILHVTSSQKTAETHEPEKSEVRIVARILPSETDETSSPVPVTKARDSSSSLFGFLKTSNKKNKPASTEAEVVSYPSTSDRYDGPLDSVNRHDDLITLPLEHQPRVPYVAKYSKPVVTKEVHDEPETETKRFRFIARMRHDGEEETIEKDQVKPELYGLASTSYDGPLEDTHRNDDLEQLPILDHAQVYHPGQSWLKVKTSPVKETREEHKDPKKKAILHVTSSQKTAETHEPEKSEVRIVARILPSETDETSSHEPVPATKARDSSSSLFGFLKTSNKKSKPASTEAEVVSYPSTSDRYDGPLDSVNRHDDLITLPLEHQPRVPYVAKYSKPVVTKEVHDEPETETKRFRFIARMRHDGEEETIEKDQVKPELYGLASTSYDGPLEDTHRNDDLEQLPILDHAQVYHPGQSWLKVKTSPVKESHEEHKEVKEPKKKAILHVTSSQKTAETHEPEKSEVRIVARILPSETDETSSPVPVTKARDSSSSLFGFLKTSNKKNKPASTEAEVVSYPSTSDRYDGPLDSVNRHNDLITLPLEHQPRVPYVAKYSKPVVTKEVHDEPETETKRFRFIARMRHDGEEETIEKDQVKPELYGLASTSYDGPLEDTHRNDDLEQLPILDHAQVYHPGQSWLKVKTSPVKETREEHKDPKKKAILHVTSSQKTAETHEPEKSEVRIVARILPSETDETSSHEPVPATKARDSSSSLFGFLKTSNKKSKPASTEAEVVSYPSTSDRYDGPLDSVNRHDDCITLPLEHQPRVPYVAKYSKPVVTKEVHDEPETETKRFRFIARMRHDGEEETIEKDQVKPELYGLASTSYDGPLEDTHRNDDLEQLPILDHAQVYHPGQSWLKVKTSPVKESHEEHKEVKEPKKKAILHVTSSQKTAETHEPEKSEVRIVARILPSETDETSSPVPVTKARDSSSSLFGFLKTSNKKNKPASTEAEVVSYPSTSDRYDGPLDSVNRHDDLITLPLEHQPRVPYVAKYSKPVVTKEVHDEPETETKRFRFIARMRHDGEEETIEKDQVKPELYGLASTSYDGPLEDTHRNDDLEQLPILDHAQVYHPGQSWLKVKTSPVKESHEEHKEVKEPKKKAILHVTSSQKTAETHEPEKSEVRIVARILPSETDETSSPVPVTKARDSSSSLFGFLKTSNKKNKPASTEAEVVSYPSTSDRYDGPLDSVNRHDDLITLPLEHQPRVPYVAKYSKPVVTKEVHDEPETETKRFRFIARMRHDGEEETIEKDQVKPELYGLASTSYDGPLEDTHRNDDLEQLPILDHAQVYHPGQSWLKVKTSPVKESHEEHKEVKEPKKKAILHVTSSQKTAETHEPEKSEVRIVARILPSETDETSSHEPVPATKARDSSSSLFGFLKTSNKKSKPASTEAEVVSYPSTSDRYDGPLDSVNRHDDLITLPLEHQPRVPYVAKYSKPVVTKEVHDEPETETKRFRFIARMRHDGEEETIEKDQVKPELYGLASTSYDGPLEDTHRNDDLEQLPILDHAQVYHPGQSWLKVKTSPVKETREEHKDPKKKAILHVTSSQKTAETHEPEKSEVRIVARILPSETDETSSHEPVPATKARDSSSSLFGFLKTSNKKSKPASTEAEVVSYPSTSDRYDGPLDSVNRHDDLITLPLEHQPRVPYVAKYSKPVVTKEVHDEPETETKRFRFIARMRHDGEEETIEKDQVKPELYGLASTSYDGPLEDTHRNDDLEQLPILDHAQVYHPGQSWLKVKTSPVKESHEEHKEVKEPKKKAILHVTSSQKTAETHEPEKSEVRIVARILPSETDETSSPVPVTKARDSSSSLFGFLKTSNKKNKPASTEAEVVSYPSTSDRYDGPLDSVNRHDDLITLPLEHQPRVPYVAKYSKPVVTKEVHDEPETETKRFRFIARMRHDGEEETIEKDQVKPELYGLASTSYDGPLEDTHRNDDLEQLPILDHAQVYHPGQSWLKVKTSPVKESHEEHKEVKEPKKKAILHVTSSQKTAETHEPEKSEVRIVARILPSETDETSSPVPVTKARDSSSSLFGFLKTSNKKNKPASTEAEVVSYPSTSDRYDGPLDSVNRHDDLITLPLEHQPRVPYVAKYSKPVVTKEVHDEPETETKRFRFIARMRHDGEEETIEKDQVKPELYGLASTSYDGPLEDTHRNDDLEQLPILDHAQVYHPGQSWLKVKTSPVKESHEEHKEVKEPKKKAILHVTSSQKTAETHEPEKSEVRIVARILPSETDETSSHEPVPATKARDSSSSLFGFLKTSNKKSKPASTEAEVVSYPSTSDRYDGPLDSVNRHDDLITLPLEHQPRVPYVAKYSKPVVTKEVHDEPETETKRFRFIARMRHDGEEETIEKDQVKPELYGLASTSYDGPLEDTHRNDDLEQLPILDHAQVYHPGQSWLKVKTSPVKESHEEHKEVKEPKKKAILHVTSSQKTAETHEPEKSEVRIVARILPSETDETSSPVPVTKARDSSSSLFGFLKTSNKKNKPASTEAEVVSYPSTSDRYDGPLDSVNRHDDLITLPLEHQPRVPYVAKYSKPVVTKEVHDEPETETKRFRFIARMRHDGEEETIEKDQVKPELYGLASTSYDGPLEDTHRNDDLEQLPILDHAQVYHPGQSWLKVKTSPVKETREEHKDPKKKAILHVTSSQKTAETHEPEKSEVRIVARILPSETDETSSPVPVTKARDSSSSFLGLWKLKSRKRQRDRNEFSSRVEEMGSHKQYSSSLAFHSEGTTVDGQQWTEVRVERRVEVQLEPVFYLTGAGLGAVSEDENGLIFTATPTTMAPAGRSFLSRLGFKSKKSKKSKGEHEPNSSDSSSSSDEDHRVKVVPVVESLSTTIAEAERLNQRSPRLEHAERTITVRALAPLPVSFEESGQPHTTVASWQETTVLPDNVTVEYDDHGNRVTRTVKTSQVKHTVQKQTFQNYTVPDENDPSSTVERTREQLTPLGISTHTGPIVDTKTRSVVYEASTPVQGEAESLGEFVSSKTVTTGNRTIETITYKTERDGIIETHVEHRVTILSDSPIDHDAELSAAIAEATQMNPDMTVEKIEVRQETST